LLAGHPKVWGESISSGVQDMIRTVKFDEDKSKYASLAQENGFRSA